MILPGSLVSGPCERHEKNCQEHDGNADGNYCWQRVTSKEPFYRQYYWDMKMMLSRAFLGIISVDKDITQQPARCSLSFFFHVGLVLEYFASTYRSEAWWPGPPSSNTSPTQVYSKPTSKRMRWWEKEFLREKFTSRFLREERIKCEEILWI